MARFCTNCGCELPMVGRTLKFKSQKAEFCRDCMKIIEPLLHDIQHNAEKNCQDIGVAFDDVIEKTELRQDVQRLVRKEFDALYLERYAKKYIVRRFSGSFDECYQILSQAVSAAQGFMGETFDTCILERGGVKNATFLITDYTRVLCDSYTALAVNLIHHGNEATVITIGAGEFLGVHEKLDKRLWKYIEDNHPNLDVKIIRKPEMQQVMSMNKKKIGVLGGSFDPVHNGHVTLGCAAIEEAALEKLIIMPAHVQPFKIGREFAADEHRLEMCRLAFEGVERAEVSNYEMEHTEISYTFDTLAYLKKIYPDSKLYFITGTDSFLDIEYWRKGKDLLGNYGFIVSVRPGYKEKELEERIRYYEAVYGTDIVRLRHEMPDVSSTEIKARRNQKLSISDMIPESVERYINEHELYL